MSGFGQTLYTLLAALFAPWRLASRVTPGRFRWFGCHTVTGLLIVPSIALSFWLADLLISVPEAQSLSAPQAGMLATLSEGLVHSELPPFTTLAWRLGAAAFGWLLGAILAGLLGAAVSFLLLWGLAGRDRSSQVPALVHLGSWATSYLPVAALALTLWLSAYADVKTGARTGAAHYLLCSLLTLWATLGQGALAWGMLLQVPHANPLRTALGSGLYAVLSWGIAFLAVQVAWPLTWAPLTAAENLFG